MMSSLDQHDLAISRCGVPMIAELLHICINDSQAESLDRALIWLGLLHGLEELEPALATAATPLSLTQEQAVALYTAMHLTGDPVQGSLPLHRLLAGSVSDGTKSREPTPEAAILWEVRNRVMELANRSSYAELIRQASLLHLTDPSALLDNWLGQLDEFIATRMPFTALLRLSILCLNPEAMPDGWQLRLANAITEIGDLADAIPLYRFWMVLCQVAPDWDFACIRAADLALRFEDFAIANHLLERLEKTDVQNAWFYDVRARHRYAYGNLSEAVRMWSIALSKTETWSPDREVFHDRMLVALRGKFGLAEASRLTRCGNFKAALQLIKTLILNDPSFPSYYNLLASLQAGFEDCNDQWNCQAHEQTLLDSLIDRFRPLWVEKESPVDPGDSSEQLWQFVQEAAAFLDSCEHSLSLA